MERNTIPQRMANECAMDWFKRIHDIISLMSPEQQIQTLGEIWTDGWIEGLNNGDKDSICKDRPKKEENHQRSSVNHPAHYNSHPSGIECIEIVRHYDFNIGNAIKYLWRQGLKQEQGLDPIQKQIEDCNKAIWYINDHIKELQKQQSEPERSEEKSRICEDCDFYNIFDHTCKIVGFIKHPKLTTCNQFQKRDGSK